MAKVNLYFICKLNTKRKDLQDLIYLFLLLLLKLHFGASILNVPFVFFIQVFS